MVMGIASHIPHINGTVVQTLLMTHTWNILLSGEKARAEASEYAKLLAKKAKEVRERRMEKRRLSSKKSSTSSQ